MPLALIFIGHLTHRTENIPLRAALTPAIQPIHRSKGPIYSLPRDLEPWSEYNMHIQARSA